MRERATILKVGDVPRLMQRLECPDREAPIIVVSTVRDSPDHTLVDPNDLGRKLAGAASVYILPSTPDVFGEVQYLMQRNYQCLNGMVRVYMPRVRLDSERDFKRHRFFSQTKIVEDGSEVVVSTIVRSMARRTPFRSPIDVQDIDDVAVRSRESSLSRLRAELAASTSKRDSAAIREWSELLEQDNTRLLAEKADLERRVEGYKSRLEELDGEVEELRDNLRHAEYRRDESHKRAIALDQELRESRLAVEVWEGLSSFPRTVLEVLDLVSKLFPAKIVVLEEARRSAEGWEFDADRAWQVLRAIARYLPQLHFDSPGTDIEKEFRARTGFKLAMTEGEQTKRNRKLMEKRRRTYNGREIDVTPHVRVGNRKPDMLCIYYFADHEGKTIVIGHCGDHLPTDGTRRRGEG